MNVPTNQDAAIALASMGLHVFPCHPNKKPMVKEWEQAATCSPFEIAVKWGSTPDALPAIPTSAHSIVVIDCDVKDGKNGIAEFRTLCAAHCIDLSTAFVVETPSKGLHFYFRSEQTFVGEVEKVAPGVDVRSHGNYVIAPGATLPDGRSYKIIAGTWSNIPALPLPLAALLHEKRLTGSPQVTGEPVAVTVTDRERAFAKAALVDEVGKLSAMGEGSGRNAALNTAAHSLATMEGWIDLNTVYSELLDAAIANGYATKDGEAAARRTIESGIEAGRMKPRPLLTDASPNVDLSGMLASSIAAFKMRQNGKPLKEWPASLNDEAYIGIAGDLVRLVAPHTEGDHQ